MSERKDLTGKRFGRLVAVKYSHTEYGNRRAMWHCQCDCGNTTIVSANNLGSGHTLSCGCKKKITHGLSRSGGKRTKLYSVWSTMIQRCTNPRNASFKYYGKMGVLIYEKWLNFEGFHKWAMSSGYSEGLTIDRINPSGNYHPDNCRWIPMSLQSLNHRPRKGTGVYWEERKKRWRARVTLRGKSSTKYFLTRDEALSFVEKEREILFSQTIKLSVDPDCPTLEVSYE